MKITRGNVQMSVSTTAEELFKEDSAHIVIEVLSGENHCMIKLTRKAGDKG